MEIDLSDVDIQRQLIELDRVDFEDDLMAFFRAAWPHIDSAEWVEGFPVQAVAEHLEAVADGQIRRLLINIPPRCAKSSLVSVAFPAWVWAQRHRSPTSGPGVPILTASYGDRLAQRDSRKSRQLIESPWYRRYWGDRYSLLIDQNTKDRFINSEGGERLVTSVGAKVTGEGGNCFVAGTLVSTPTGERPIEALAVGDEVLAFDHSRGKVVTSKVVATKARVSSDTYHLRTLSGLGFVCTGDHPIYSPGRGYVAASRLGAGDGLVVQERARNHAAPAVRQLRAECREAPACRAQGAESGQPRRLLLKGLLRGSPRNEKFDCEVPDVRGLCRPQESPLLFRRLQARQPGGARQSAAVPPLRGLVRHEAQRVWCKILDEILHASLRRRSPLGAHGGRGKFQFCGLGPLLQPVLAYAGGGHGAGWGAVRGVRGAGDVPPQKRAFDIARPPHRQEPPQQHAREPDHALPAMSLAAPRWHADRVASVAPVGAGEVSVYDIQVAGQSNFFAGGVLVHNCIIVDDPNAANEANSEAKIAEVLEWWDGTMSSRLSNMKKGAFIVIQQRLAENDLTGHILEKQIGDWDHLVLPMRYEPERSFHTSIGWKDPREEPGQLLWPERFGEAEVALLEKQMGPYTAAGQLQQRPEPPGGGVIKREWWQLWEEPNFPPMDFIMASLDTAYTLKTTNDFSAMTVWGVFSDRTYATTSRFIGSDGRPSYVERDYAETAPKLMLMYAFQARLEIHELVEKVATVCRGMKVDKLVIENKAAGHSVSQELRRLYGNEKFSVQLYDPKSIDKLSRLYSVQHLFSEGMVYAPDRVWAEMVMTQVGQFPKGRHDDLVDTVSMAIRHMRDLGLLQRVSEKIEEYEGLKVYPGRGADPLYPA